MAVEIEAKLKVESFAAVYAAIKEHGAQLVANYLESNTFFDTEDRSLLAADEGLRLRRNHDLDRGTDEFVITYKGPRQQSQLKAREEQELTVGSEQDAVVLLSRLGYGVVLQFQKRRQSWKLKDCKVELDELPYMGCYVEVEGPSEPSVQAVRGLLGLSAKPIVRASYVALLLNYLQEHGKAERIIRFAEEEPPVARAG